jgi:hypothetical protein
VNFSVNLGRERKRKETLSSEVGMESGETTYKTCGSSSQAQEDMSKNCYYREGRGINIHADELNSVRKGGVDGPIESKLRPVKLHLRS